MCCASFVAHAFRSPDVPSMATASKCTSRDDTDVENAMSKLRELSQPLSGILGSSGQRSVDITENAGDLITTDAVGCGGRGTCPPGG